MTIGVPLNVIPNRDVLMYTPRKRIRNLALSRIPYDGRTSPDFTPSFVTVA